jgi:hypothetical protein
VANDADALTAANRTFDDIARFSRSRAIARRTNNLPFYLELWGGSTFLLTEANRGDEQGNCPPKKIKLTLKDLPV